MENPSFVNGGIRLPIGYRFRPTDEELVVHYLKRKAFGLQLPASIIPDFNVFHTDPWGLPGDLKEKRYFFGKRNGNVSDNNNLKIGAGSGYWKYTGKDRQIVGSAAGNRREAVGVRRTLVFCQGKRARDDTKTRWVMHEYRLLMGTTATTTTANFNSTHLMIMSDQVPELGAEWVVHRIFQRKKKPKKHGPVGPVVTNLSNSSKNQTNGMKRQDCIVFSAENVENCDVLGPPQPSSSCSSEVTDEICSNVLDQEETSSAYAHFSFNSFIRKY